MQSHYHIDPLQHVLVAPVDEDDPPPADAAAAGAYKFDADAQSSRGATGMTTGLRAASIASNLGELRIFLAADAHSNTTTTLQQQQQQQQPRRALAVATPLSPPRGAVIWNSRPTTRRREERTAGW